VTYPLFDPDGEALKDSGMELARNAVPDWSDVARAGIVALVATGAAFTSEDLVRLVGLPRPAEGTNRNNAVGAVFSAAAKARLIRRIGYAKCARPSSHARVLAVWVAG
jgi:hypothetical protein